MTFKIIKKDGSLEDFSNDKIKVAVNKAAFRCDVTVPDDKLNVIANQVYQRLNKATNTPVADVHEYVIATLSGMGYKDIADSYAEYRYYKTSYAKTFEQLRQDADDVLRLGDRENANFDSSLVSTKGSLIKGYLTKSLYKQFYLSKTEKNLIERGDIYIHDLRDMILGSINCLDSSTWVTIRQNGEISTITLNDLRKRLNIEEGIFALSRGVQILSRNGWVGLEGVSVRKLESNEAIYEIKPQNGLPVKATANHRIPVITADGEEVIKYVKDIVVGDSLVSVANVKVEANDCIIDLCDYADEDNTYVGNMRLVKRYFEYKYDRSLQSFCKSKGIESDKNLRCMRLRAFNELKKHIDLPYEVYSKLVIYRKGASAKIPLLLAVTNELARMFGYVFADGCVAKNSEGGCYQVNFSSTHIPLLADFVCSAETAFPDVRAVRREPVSTSTTPCTSVTLCNAVVWDLFRKFKQNAANIEIPNFVLNGSDEIKYNFLVAAMDCDGHYGDTQFKYSTVAQKYAEQFALILKSLGYNPTISKKECKGSIYKAREIVGKRNYDLYEVSMSQYADQKRFIGKVNSLRENGVNIKERNVIPRNPSKIVKITEQYDDDAYVFDLETEDSWFIANGHVVHNCCLFDMATLLKGGFEMSNVKYTEPKSVLSALQVIGDVTLVASAQQFGGFTIPEIDKTLLPYCHKTYETAYDKYFEKLKIRQDIASKMAIEDVKRELEQGFQSLELKLNTVPSSRGDFAFTTLTFGQWKELDCELDYMFMFMIGKAILDTRRNGHGVNHQPVVFPKLVYLYDENQVNNDNYASALFDEAVKCSSKCMYPDYLSLTSKFGTVSNLYKETGVITSPMGCRAYLSPWADESGEYHAIGRCNIGAVSINLPIIITRAKIEHPNDWETAFWSMLDDVLENIRSFLKKRYEIISHQKCSSNPLAYTQGGFLFGNKKPDDEVGDLIRYMTASFGITALDEATYLFTGKRMIEDEGKFANRVLRHLNDVVAHFKKEDGHLYALYGTPAESLCATQCKQYADFCKKMGVKNVFENHEHYSTEYFSNSFHVNVTEEITPFEKQNYEFENFHLCEGGHIQYVRLDNPDNFEAVKACIQRGMEMGFYQGVNFDSAYCQDCGKHSTNVLFECPHCGSKNISVISRVCGYLGYSNVNGHSRMNDGKMCEINRRKSM